MYDGVSISVPAVEAPDGRFGVRGEVVHHLGQVAGHQALVGDNRNLECRYLIVVLFENSLPDLTVLVPDQPLYNGVNLRVNLSWVF